MLFIILEYGIFLIFHSYTII